MRSGISNVTRRMAVSLSIASTTALIAGCSSASSGSPEPSSKVVTVELHAPAFGGRSGDQCETGPKDIEDGPFRLGAEIRLEDENGVILGRTKMPKGKFISDLNCQVNLVFAIAPDSNPRMYIVVNDRRSGWKLMPSEIVPGPAVIDFMENLPEDDL